LEEYEKVETKMNISPLVPKTTLEPALERERERYFGHVLLVFTTPPRRFTINTSLEPARFPTEKS
jgi:hypothetical protein